jgi:hypothetical protein
MATVWGKLQAKNLSGVVLCSIADLVLTHCCPANYSPYHQWQIPKTDALGLTRTRRHIRLTQYMLADSHATIFQVLSILFLFKQRLMYDVLFFLFGNAPAEHLPGYHGNYQVASSYA